MLSASFAPVPSEVTAARHFAEDAGNDLGCVPEDLALVVERIGIQCVSTRTQSLYGLIEARGRSRLGGSGRHRSIIGGRLAAERWNVRSRHVYRHGDSRELRDETTPCREDGGVNARLLGVQFDPQNISQTSNLEDSICAGTGRADDQGRLLGSNALCRARITARPEESTNSSETRSRTTSPGSSAIRSLSFS